MRESRESNTIIAIVDDAEIATEPLDLECRKNMMLASLEAGFPSNTRLGAVHARSNYAQF
jgi:alcohol dehydrogenase class IV